MKISYKGGIIKEGFVSCIYNLSSKYDDPVLVKALQTPFNIIKESNMDLVEIPFPYLRFKELLTKVESIANIWSSIGLDVSKKKN